MLKEIEPTSHNACLTLGESIKIEPVRIVIGGLYSFNVSKLSMSAAVDMAQGVSKIVADGVLVRLHVHEHRTTPVHYIYSQGKETGRA